MDQQSDQRNRQQVDNNARNGKTSEKPCGKRDHHACLYGKLGTDEHTECGGNSFKTDTPQARIAVVEISAYADAQPEQGEEADAMGRMEEEIEANNADRQEQEEPPQEEKERCPP